MLTIRAGVGEWLAAVGADRWVAADWRTPRLTICIVIAANRSCVEAGQGRQPGRPELTKPGTLPPASRDVSLSRTAVDRARLESGLP